MSQWINDDTSWIRLTCRHFRTFSRVFRSLQSPTHSHTHTMRGIAFWRNLLILHLENNSVNSFNSSNEEFCEFCELIARKWTTCNFYKRKHFEAICFDYLFWYKYISCDSLKLCAHILCWNLLRKYDEDSRFTVAERYWRTQNTFIIIGNNCVVRSIPYLVFVCVACIFII